MWAWMVVWSGLASGVMAFCPSKCTCDDSVPNANCVGGGITILPILFNPALKKLNMGHNSITSISESLIFFSQLEELDLSHNMLTSIGIGNLQEQKKLRELRLAHNNLVTLKPGALKGLKSLTLLDISHNELTELPSGVLGDLIELSVLLLAHNNLHFLSQHTFRGLYSLHFIDICHNYFRNVPASAIHHLSAVKSILLCYNRLTRIESKDFTTVALTSLSLESNNINWVAVDAFQHLTELKQLNFNNNQLKEVPVIPHSVTSLVLSNNNLTTIGPAEFNNLSNLATLDISRCPRLAWFHPDAFSHCTNLQRLIISHNPLIRHLPMGLLSSLPRLSRLDLRANSLQTLSEASLPMKSLVFLDLRNNTLVCNCSLQWLASVVAGVNTTLEAPDIRCSAPPKLRGFYLSRLRGSGQVCGWWGQIVASVTVVACCVLLLAALTLLLFRYRRRQTREKLGRGWPPGPEAPWPPDHNSAPTRHIMADDYVYHTYSLVRKVPVTEV